MNKKIIKFFIFAIVFFSITSTVTGSVNIISSESEEKLEDKCPKCDTEYYALIVGVEKFKYFEYPNEDKIDDTAIAMYERLVNSSNWKKENIKLLLNENATKENIHNAVINWLDEKENKNDIVLIFYTSHGWKLPIFLWWYGHSSVFTYELEIDDIFKGEVGKGKISDREFDSWLDELESEHIVVILEACWSGRMINLRQYGRVVLTAGGRFLFFIPGYLPLIPRYCPVDEDDSLGYDIFTYFLFQGFDGVADINNDGWITAEEVFHYARWPTFWFSLWKQFPYIGKYKNVIIGPQLPFMYDLHPKQIPLIHMTMRD